MQRALLVDHEAGCCDHEGPSSPVTGGQVPALSRKWAGSNKKILYDECIYKNMEYAGDVQVKTDAIHQVRAAFRPCKTSTQCRQSLDCATAAGLWTMKQKQGKRALIDFDVPRRDVQERNMCLDTISMSSRNAAGYTRFENFAFLARRGRRKVLAGFRINRSITEAEVGFPLLRADSFSGSIQPCLE